MRFSRMLGPTEALADRALLQSAGGELLPTGERSDGFESFAGPARGRTSKPCPLLIACIAITLAACGTAGPGGSPYHASGRPEAAAVTPAVGVPARATGTPAPGGQPPAPGPGSTSAALNLRLLAKVSPSGGDGDLPVGPGDLIEVSVFEVEELSKLKLRIPARGMISLPLIGQVQAAGRTATELEDEIRTKLQQKFMHDPQVSIFVHEHNSQRVSVMGAVRRGGVITLNRQLRLADALATAEGLADDAHHVVYVIRQVPAGTVSQLRASAAGGSGATSPPATSPPADAKEEVMTPIDLSELADGRDELNLSLRPGDVIHVPRAGSFYVVGSVERSGSFLLKEKTTLQQAILAAGGVKNVVDWTDIRLYRKTPSGQVEVTTVDLNAVEAGQAAPELRPNDVVIVGMHAGKAVFYGFIDFFKGALGVAKGI